jgi:isoleucyl-tRNA synthetase
VVGSDYSEDLRIGPEILKQHADIYRRLRNTIRFLLGNLNDFNAQERVDLADMPELERWVLHRLWEMDRSLRQACDDFQFHTLFAELHNFCTVDLSAFYFDVRKDSLYCDRADNIKRRAARTVLDELFNCLTAWLAPFICFTAEEAWLARNPDDQATGSVHLRTFPDIPDAWRDDALAEKWRTIRRLRRVVTGAIELERAEKRMGSSLQSQPVVYTTPEYLDVFNGLDASELFITSGARLENGEAPAGAFTLEDVAEVAVVPAPASGEKCQRCYQILDEVGGNDEFPETCNRCADAAQHSAA